MPNLFTQEQAHTFVKKIIDAILIEGNVEVVKQCYATDAIAHFGELEINIEDIINRTNYNKTMYTQQQHFLLDVITFDNVIVFRDKQQGRSKKTNGNFSVDLTAIYRIENNQVKEAWLMTDACFNYKADAAKDEHDGIIKPEAAIIKTDVNTAYKMFKQTIE